MEKVDFLGKSYPVSFDMLAIERVADDLKVDSIEEIAKTMQGSLGNMLRLGRITTFRGIERGAQLSKEEQPFESSDDLAKEDVKMTDFVPFSNLFTKALLGFFSVDAIKGEPEAKKKKGAA